MICVVVQANSGVDESIETINKLNILIAQALASICVYYVNLCVRVRVHVCVRVCVRVRVRVLYIRYHIPAPICACRYEWMHIPFESLVDFLLCFLHTYIFSYSTRICARVHTNHTGPPGFMRGARLDCIRDAKLFAMKKSHVRTSSLTMYVSSDVYKQCTNKEMERARTQMEVMRTFCVSHFAILFFSECMRTWYIYILLCELKIVLLLTS